MGQACYQGKEKIACKTEAKTNADERDSNVDENWPAIFYVSKAAQHTVTKPLPAVDSLSVLEENSKDNLLHSKIDTLISKSRDFKPHSKKSKDITSTPLSAIDGKYAKEVSKLLLKWPDVKNVIDLVDAYSHIRFFAGDES